VLGRLIRNDILRDGETISGALLAALGVYVFLQSRGWDYYTDDGPGPGFFPYWYGIAMVLLSLMLIANRIRKFETERGHAINWRGTGRALGAWLAFAASVALMEPLGFVLSFALLTFVIVAFIFQKPPLTAGLTAIIVALAFHLAFPVILSVPLPTGFLGF
jgi:putative tricarboxylic transport membrane protein